jgi:UDP-glucose 4-epimerase
MEKVLVTGASGFIGKVLCQRLQEEKKWVKALARKATEGPFDELILCDLYHLKQIPLPSHLMSGIETVFHLAGIAHARADKNQYQTLNVEASTQLLELAQQSGVKRFVYFSSVKAETPKDEYGRSKAKAERIILDYGKKQDMHVTIIRPALVYGLGMKGNLWSMLKAVEMGYFPPIPEIHNKRSMVGVRDLVEAALLVAKHDEAKGKIYSVTDGISYSTRKLYDMMRENLGLTPASWSLPLWPLLLLEKFGLTSLPFFDKLLGSAYFSHEDIHRDLGFEPKENLIKTLPEIVDYYKTVKSKSR